MSSHKRLIIFFIISLGIHISILYFSKPQLLLFSSLQNIKLKKKEITKVKLIKIRPKPKPKYKPKPKSITKPKIKQKQKPKPKLKPKHRPKPKPKPKPKGKAKIKTKFKKESKLKFKHKTKIKKNLKVKSKKEKVDLSLIRKKVAAIKKREEEEKIKEELKKEAAYFYANRLVSLVQRLWIFPKSIQDSELPFLKIKIKLRVRKDGTIVGEPVIISKSKNKIFNESALRAVKKLYKYKIPLPSIIDDKYIDIILTLTPPEK